MRRLPVLKENMNAQQDPGAPSAGSLKCLKHGLSITCKKSSWFFMVGWTIKLNLVDASNPREDKRGSTETFGLRGLVETSEETGWKSATVVFCQSICYCKYSNPMLEQVWWTLSFKKTEIINNNKFASLALVKVLLCNLKFNILWHLSRGSEFFEMHDFIV